MSTRLRLERPGPHRTALCAALALLAFACVTVEAAYVITQYIAISKFGDALGVELEPVFDGLQPILPVEHAP